MQTGARSGGRIPASEALGAVRGYVRRLGLTTRAASSQAFAQRRASTTPARISSRAVGSGRGRCPDRQALSQADVHRRRKASGADEARLTPSMTSGLTSQLGRFEL